MRVLFISLLLIGASQLLAQVSIRPQMGFNTTTFRHSGDEDFFEHGIGFQFGVDAQLGRSVYIQPGIFWESMENELYQEIDDPQSSVRVDRVRIPLMLGYKLAGHHTGGWINARLFTGPNLSYNVSKDLSADPLINRDDFRRATWGWNAGMGLDLAFLFVDVGYQFGLSEVSDRFSGTDRNNLFYGNVGLRIGF